MSSCARTADGSRHRLASRSCICADIRMLALQPSQSAGRCVADAPCAARRALAKRTGRCSSAMEKDAISTMVFVETVGRERRVVTNLKIGSGSFACLVSQLPSRGLKSCACIWIKRRHYCWKEQEDHITYIVVYTIYTVFRLIAFHGSFLSGSDGCRAHSSPQLT